MSGLGWAVFVQGFALCGGLIVAIGAQNVFVLTQGARGNRPWLAASLCTACDALLIAFGVGGVGAAVSGSPALSGSLALAGAAFLAVYGLRALKSSLRGESMRLDAGTERSSVRSVLLGALGVSLLNPHALLDTVVLIGGMSGQMDAVSRLRFGLGAATASCCWFFSLSLGGRIMAPLLAKPGVWRVLDLLVCLTMWTLAVGIAGEALAFLRF